MFKKLPKVNFGQMGKSSPNPVTLIQFAKVEL
jgi:hypothetical protein